MELACAVHQTYELAAFFDYVSRNRGPGGPRREQSSHKSIKEGDPNLQRYDCRHDPCARSVYYADIQALVHAFCQCSMCATCQAVAFELELHRMDALCKLGVTRVITLSIPHGKREDLRGVSQRFRCLLAKLWARVRRIRQKHGLVSSFRYRCYFGHSAKANVIDAHVLTDLALPLGELTAMWGQVAGTNGPSVHVRENTVVDFLSMTIYLLQENTRRTMELGLRKLPAVTGSRGLGFVSPHPVGWPAYLDVYFRKEKELAGRSAVCPPRPKRIPRATGVAAGHEPEDGLYHNPFLVKITPEVVARLANLPRVGAGARVS